MHKLGSSPIGCEDFSIPGGITKVVSVCNLGKAKAKQRQNYCSITIILSVAHIHNHSLWIQPYLLRKWDWGMI